ncbi:hypothetical protein PIB30_063916 [Stylosanthes scabra]|uniref:Uncharacterized protein n=1 Tax=Stylosanthes scabra TaxID=79078 RepID=A0ABU6VJY6_9FABA|nr:hypothetical protein [Stylosanthes scabra]
MENSKVKWERSHAGLYIGESCIPSVAATARSTTISQCRGHWLWHHVSLVSRPHPTAPSLSTNYAPPRHLFRKTWPVPPPSPWHSHIPNTQPVLATLGTTNKKCRRKREHWRNKPVSRVGGATLVQSLWWSAATTGHWNRGGCAAMSGCGTGEMSHAMVGCGIVENQYAT